MALFKIFNGPSPTTGPQVAFATGTSIKTMLQLKMLAGIPAKVKAWGCSMEGAAAAAGVQWELIETGTVFATGMVAHVDAGIVAWDAAALVVTKATYFDYGTADTAYQDAAVTEGSITASRVFDAQYVQPTGQYAWEFSLGNEPDISLISSLRIRVLAGTDVDAICWFLIEV